MITKLLSSDSHLVEPPDLWENRLPKALREKGPQVQRVAVTEGLRGSGEVDYWFVDGVQTHSPFAMVLNPGARLERTDRTSISLEITVDDLRESTGAAALNPKTYVADSERDHVDGQVLFPTFGLVLYGTPDGALLSECFRAYNDWAVDFCSAVPNRLKPFALLNVDDPAEAAGELARARDRGVVGALIPVAPDPDTPYSDPSYEPLWAAAADLGTPLAMHLASHRTPSKTRGLSRKQGQMSIGAADMPNQDVFIRQSLGHLIYSGVFERHPNLKVGSIEHELGWIPYFLNRLDYTYTDRPHRLGWNKFADSTVLPSDFWRQNCYASFQEDPTVTATQWEVIGIDNLTWGSDYPHYETTFPQSLETVNRVLSDLDEDTQYKIGYGNTKDLFGFDD